MTAKEARDSGVRFIRLPEWAPGYKLELPEKDEASGLFGPWCKLHDIMPEKEPVPVLFYELGEYDSWEGC